MDRVRSLSPVVPILIVQMLPIALLLFLFQALPQASAAPPTEPIPSRAAQMPPDVHISVSDVVASGFIRPLQVTHAGDGSGRLFVVDQQGLISVVSGTVLSPPFLDIRSLVERGGNEQGLLGLAFHPNYATNGYFYVDYTRLGDGATVVARYSVSADPNVADAASATEVMTVTQPDTHHNGGQIVFGPDGYLYIGLGDGGNTGDPMGNGQNTTTPLGSILRIDVDGGPPYGVPADNPFVGVEGLDEIWDYGLRNPWRFSFDRLTGDLYIGDVGQDAWEEIDFQGAGTAGGLNFGWNCKEGTHDYDFTAQCALADLIDPITEYAHPPAMARSVTGGFVYRGSRYPALQGRYFFADFISGEIWSMYQAGSNPDTWSTPELELDTNMLISSFGEDEAGELYVVDLGGGTVRRVTAFDQFIYLPLVMMNATAP